MQDRGCNADMSLDCRTPRSDNNVIQSERPDIANLLHPPINLEHIFLKCQSYAQRRRLWNPWPKDSFELFQSLKHWVSIPGSSLFVVQALAVSSATARAEDFALEVADYLKSTTPYKVIWILSPPNILSVTNLLNTLIFQAVCDKPNLFLSQLSASQPQADYTENQLFDLLPMVFSQLSECFVIIETKN